MSSQRHVSNERMLNGWNQLHDVKNVFVIRLNLIKEDLKNLIYEVMNKEQVAHLYNNLLSFEIEKALLMQGLHVIQSITHGLNTT